MFAATSWRGAAGRRLGQRVHVVELAVVDVQRAAVPLEDVEGLVVWGGYSLRQFDRSVGDGAFDRESLSSSFRGVVEAGSGCLPGATC